MTREEVYVKLTGIFRDIFDDEDLTISDVTTANDIEDWDSLEQINIIVATENEFGITLNIAEINAMKNVGGFVDIILRKVTEK